MSNLVEHAKRELELCGQTAEDPAYAASIVAAVAAFASYGHSGGSAGTAIEQLHQLLQFKTLSPLTSDPDEWQDRSEDSGAPMWQNRRDSAAFSRDGGATWYFVDERADQSPAAPAVCRCPANEAGDIRCHNCGERVNKRCWKCGTPRGDCPCPTAGLSPTSDTQTSETAEQLHARFAHPGWEYETTTGQRKAFDGHQPPGEGWERNVDYHDGWERFDYHEEAYWRRPATPDTTQETKP